MCRITEEIERDGSKLDQNFEEVADEQRSEFMKDQTNLYITLRICFHAANG